MSLENTSYWNHIVRYFSDTLSATEEQELFKWLAAHPDYKEDFNQIDVSHLKSGLLFVKVETDQGVLTKKIIKE